eukprot:Hpha_TRINITY_DN15593_c5_g2::TRINITY_DN15593_c5_g2_i4::g.104868::m.104868/K03424/tatD; TatD DNase family protein
MEQVLRSYAVISSGDEVLPLVDIGVNFPGRMSDESVAGQLRRAAAAGVTRVVITGSSMASSRRAASLCKTHRGMGVALHFTAGVHPHDARHFRAGETEGEIRQLSREEGWCAVGETGLDYDRMFSPREAQIEALTAQLRIAVELNAPVFIHERDRDPGKGEPLGSHQDLLRVLDASGIEPAKVCVHCFTGREDVLRTYVRKGYFIGLTGFVGMAARGSKLRDAIASGSLPLNRIMLETDAPYMKPDAKWMPEGWTGRNTEACGVPGVCRALAACVPSWSPEGVAKATTESSLRFFSLRSPSPSRDAGPPDVVLVGSSILSRWASVSADLSPLQVVNGGVIFISPSWLYAAHPEARRPSRPVIRLHQENAHQQNRE